MNATCRPLSIACSAASAATIVLPLPTSPCSSRCIGVARFRSCAISRHTRSCARVSLNGTRASSASVSAPRAGQHRRALRRARLAVRLQRQLLREELVELEPRPRGMRARLERALRERRQARRRRVQEQDRVAELPEMPARDQASRAASRRVSAGSRGERARDDLAQRLLREARRRRIDGRQAIGQRRARRRRPSNCGWTISRPKWPSRTSPNTRTRCPGASAFCWLG